jgi:hypothetical protein
MNRPCPAVRTEFLEFQLRCTFRHADVGAVIPATALGAFKPYIFTFTFLFCHIFNLIEGLAFTPTF